MLIFREYKIKKKLHIRPLWKIHNLYMMNKVIDDLWTLIFQLIPDLWKRKWNSLLEEFQDHVWSFYKIPHLKIYCFCFLFGKCIRYFILKQYESTRIYITNSKDGHTGNEYTVFHTLIIILPREDHLKFSISVPRRTNQQY